MIVSRLKVCYRLSSLFRSSISAHRVLQRAVTDAKVDLLNVMYVQEIAFMDALKSNNESNYKLFGLFRIYQEQIKLKKRKGSLKFILKLAFRGKGLTVFEKCGRQLADTGCLHIL